MEYGINDVSDITYLSGRIPLYIKAGGLIRANNLRCTSCCRKLCAH